MMPRSASGGNADDRVLPIEARAEMVARDLHLL
jgi:hypothetical protein